MKTKYILLACCIPLIIVAEMFAFSYIGDLVSMPNNMAVTAGVVLLCAWVFGNLFILKTIIKKFI